MLTQRQRVILACVIAAVGLVLAGRAYLRAMSKPKPTPAEHVSPVHATGRLDSSAIDTYPTKETVARHVEAVVGRARTRLAALASDGSIPASRHQDLLDAFSGWLRLTLDGDPDSDRTWKITRGMPVPKVELTDEMRAGWSASAERTRLAPLGLEGLEVRVIYHAGKRVAPESMEEGFDTLRSQKYDQHMNPMFPVPRDPASAKADVVEVRLPMSIKATNKDERGTVLMGYQFCWNADRKQWIPYSTVVYHVADGRTYSGHF